MNHLKKNSSRASRNLRCKASIGFMLAVCQALGGSGQVEAVEPVLGVSGVVGVGPFPGQAVPMTGRLAPPERLERWGGRR